MTLIAAPWYPDLRAEMYDKEADNAYKCRTMCEHFDTCAIQGQWYSGPDCKLEMDERGSR